MVLSNIRRLKAILLLSGYLYVVLIHLQYIEHLHATVDNQAPVSACIKSKGYDKSGHVALIVKKICKTVINRKLSDENNITSRHLYITTLLFDNTPLSVNDLKVSRHAAPVMALQVKGGFYLRI